MSFVLRKAGVAVCWVRNGGGEGRCSGEDEVSGAAVCVTHPWMCHSLPEEERLFFYDSHETISDATEVLRLYLPAPLRMLAVSKAERGLKDVWGGYEGKGYGIQG